MKSYLEMLKELMACRAMTDNVAGVNRAVACMEDYARQEGLYTAVEDFDGRKALFISTVAGKTAEFLLNTHLDVVAVSSEDMFTPQIRDGYVYGRGPFDDQGQALCALQVVAALKGKASVCAIFSTDEEHGGQTTIGMVNRGYAATKMGLVIDGSPYAVAVAQKGIVSLELVARGRAGHASTPWAFDNALDKLIDGYLRLRSAWKPVTENDQWHDTMAATVLQAGDPAATNQIPGEARMSLNIRYIREENHDRIVQWVREVTQLEVVEGAHHCLPMVTDDRHPLVQSLLQELRNTFPEKKVDTLRMNGATDARHLVSMGVPLGIIGLPGDDAHGPQERLLLSGVDAYRDLLIRFIQRN